MKQSLMVHSSVGNSGIKSMRENRNRRDGSCR